MALMLRALCLLVLACVMALPTLPVRAQSPLEVLMQQRKRQIIVVPQQRQVRPARRALPQARVQRAPKRIVRLRAPKPKSVAAIIEESEPGPAAPLGLPPFPGLMPQAAIAAPAQPAASLSVDGGKTIMVTGDSLGIQLGQGLREAFAEEKTVKIDSRARADTGLVNPQARNWPDYLKGIATGADPKPDLVVMLIGANDNQRLPGADGQLAEQLTDPWRAAYVARIDGVVKPLRAAKIPVIWVGLPVMKNARLSGAMLAINGIFQERVEAEGMTYLDIWDQFADTDGGYTPTGPDIAGEIQRIRAGDGVHFTKTGSRKLAFFVEQEIRKALAPKGPDIDLANLPADVNEQMLQENRRPEDALESSLFAPGDASAPAFPIKPASGAIMTLTAQPSATALSEPRSNAAAPAITDVLIKGTAPYPKPGRGDDFAWPK
jgi:uncharacterized protein